MKLDELKKKYKTHYMIAKKFGFAVNSVNYWEKVGYIPKAAQYRIFVQSNGEFKITEV
jgi:hypothetical protein